MAKHKQKQEDPADPSNVAAIKQVALEDKSSELSAREAELKRKLLASDTFKPAPAPVTISKLPPKFMEEAEEELDEASTTAKAPFRLAKEGEDEYDEIIEEKMKNESRTGAMKESDLSGLDMFSASPSGGLEEAKKIDVDVYVNEDNWDDADGYYNTRSNEIMNDRYEIVSSRGKGVFSTVLFAKDIKADDNIRAIKMIRANDVMYRAGQKEIKIANSLSADDPHNKKHIVRLLEHFEHKGHLCMVFEPMYMNLREVLRQFGRGVGININAVQAYSKQLFIALQHMKNHGIIHCDLKPDNILVNRQKNLIRVCDLGSAMYLTEVEITPYVCSRFYRPPEVILGLPYDCSLDMWSIACCIFELFTGKIMFQGRTNNHMLKLHQEAPHLNPLSPPLARILSIAGIGGYACPPACVVTSICSGSVRLMQITVRRMQIKGKIPQRMVRRGVLGETHFDEGFKFMSEEVDPLSKQAAPSSSASRRISRISHSLSLSRLRLAQLLPFLSGCALHGPVFERTGVLLVSRRSLSASSMWTSPIRT
jgi:serine/threonine protein kinase